MDNKVIFQQNSPDGMEEVIRFDKEGFHYRDQFIADAGEAHRLMVEFLRQNTQPETQGPTDEELRDLWSWAAGQDQGPWPTQQHCFARAVLARWGRPAIEPVPVAERLPGPEDCTVNPRDGQGQWCWGWVQWYDEIPYSGKWRMMRRDCLIDEASAWLPHHALPVPRQEADRG
jgi:hypothetical protein